MARAFGAEVVLRPNTLSTDTASSESALRHTLDCLLEEEQYEPDFVVFLQATSPLRKENDIQNAIDLLIKRMLIPFFLAAKLKDLPGAPMAHPCSQL